MRDDSPLAWLNRMSHRARRWILLSTILGGVGGACMVLQAGLIAHIIHEAFLERASRSSLLPSFALLIGIILIRSLLTWGREISGQRSSTLIRRHVRMLVIEQLAKLGPVYANDQRTAHLASVVLERIESLHGFFAHYLPQKTLAFVIPATLGLAVFHVSWAAGLIFLLTAPLIPLFMIVIGRGASSLNQKNFRILSRMSAHFLDTLQGLATLKTLYRSRDEADRIAVSSNSYRKGTMAVLRVAFLSSALLEFFSAVAIAMTAVYLGLHYLQYIEFGFYSRDLTLKMGLFLLLLAPEFYQPLRDLGTHYHARAEAIGAAEGICAILAATPVEQAAGASVSLEERKRPPVIEFRGVHHRFEQGSRPALIDLNLKVDSGEWLAIVGTSGAGKTTLLNLLLGFLPVQQGTILINDRDLTDLNQHDWRTQVAWVPQNPTLFHGTIADNIGLNDPHLDRNHLMDAAREARVLDFSDSLQEGLDSPVGEKGALLSGGQARRVALARALAKNAPLILLDEPTAGLDGFNERLLMHGLQRLAIGRTVIMLTHRLDTAREAHRIAVMDQGRVVEQGDHESLMAKGGVYAVLVRSGGEGL